ncbi:MAG: GNAT family N-acetyltransferase [Flavobacteriales bacterium]
MTGEKVYLRELELSDVELLYRWENDPRTWRVSGTTAPFSRHLLDAYVRSVGNIFTDGQLRTIICLKGDGKEIGTLDLFDHDPVNQRAGVGILIAEQEERGKGYARESLSLIKDHAFDRLMLHQLYCNIAAANEASLALFQKAGFGIIGRKREWIRRREHWEDEFLLQCLSTERDPE